MKNRHPRGTDARQYSAWRQQWAGMGAGSTGAAQCASAYCALRSYRSLTVRECVCCSKKQTTRAQGCINFRCADIALTVATLEKRCVALTHHPHCIAKMDDHDLWMAFFQDPDGHTLAVMQEAPKGYAPLS
jgi:hypothetical protein